MRLSTVVPPVAAFLLAAAACFLVAGLAVNLIENRSRAAVRTALLINGSDWAKVTVDGLQVALTGTAPTEAARFRALSAAGEIVDSARVLDAMKVADAAPVVPPEFSVEILRNDAGISLIGLVPQSTDRDAVTRQISRLAQGASVTDMLDTADYPKPRGWDAALSFGLEALRRLPKSKISITADKVSVTATAASVTARRQMEDSLSRDAPSGVRLETKISAPRPVITPFTLRFLIDDKGPRFDACAANTEKSRQQILKAAADAGLNSGGNCTIGLGAPSPHWGEAVVTAIQALGQIGGGTLTFSDADVSLVAPTGTPQDTFDRVTGELEAALPAVFSLHAILPKPVKVTGTGTGTPEGPPEFTATRSPEGQVQLRGRLTDERVRAAVDSYARARFGIEQVHGTTRLDPKLPDGWPVRVLAGVEALSKLSHGSIVVQPAFVEVRGQTGDPEARAEISRLLSDKLGARANFKIDVTYQKKLDPVANLPTPKECADSINTALAENKITFAPGSATIEPGAAKTLDKIAALMKDCADVKMEIGGHTDSQGREEMNLALSQARAEAVLTALMARRILTSGLEAKGYGESRPIADNKTEAGREANRRIEFTLLDPAAPADGKTPPASSETAAPPATGKTAGETTGANHNAETPHEQN